MFLVEKKSFFVGCAFGSLLLALASFWTEKIAILALLIIIAAFIIVRLIRSEWTNHLAEEMFVSALDSKIERLKNGVDNNSILVLDYLRGCLYDSLFLKGNNFIKASTKQPDFQHKYRDQWRIERHDLRKKYNEMGIDKICPEVFFFKHGLINCDKSILEYIRRRDIFDLGGYVGDSAIVLSQYTDCTVFSFELSHKNAEQFRETVKRNGLKNVVLTELGVGDQRKEIAISDTGQQSTGVCVEGTDIASLTTVDDEVCRLKANVGFIKADLEGFGLKMIYGAIDTIKKYRPVMSIGIYHNYDELFELKPFLEKHVENYVFEFQLHRFSKGRFVELTLFCYPREIVTV